jgi:hypothetical protein
MNDTAKYVPEDELTDEEIDARIAEKTKPKVSGRRNTNYLPWDEARTFMREQMLPSRGKFQEWWEREKPKTIPKFPYRVYTKEWVSWNDFLGTNNEFNKRSTISWRPMIEAIQYVHKLKLQTMNEWLVWARMPGNLPDDLPARPDLVYKEWRGWSYWLGNRQAAIVEAKKEIARTQVMYLVHEQGTPQNVVLIGVEPMGLGALKEWWERDKFDIVKFYWYDDSKAAEVKKVIEAFSTPYMEYDRQRLVPNIWEVLYYLQTLMDVVTREQMIATPSRSTLELQRV